MIELFLSIPIEIKALLLYGLIIIIWELTKRNYEI